MAVNERRRTIKELLRAELKWQKVCPQFHTSTPFVEPLWHMPSAAFVVYRVAVCAYLNGWLAVIAYWARGHATALMYFTAWGYIMLCFSTLLLAVLTIHHAILARRRLRRRRHGRRDCCLSRSDARGGMRGEEACAYSAIPGDTAVAEEAAAIPNSGGGGGHRQQSSSSATHSGEEEEDEEDEDRERRAVRLQVHSDCRDAFAASAAAVGAADEPSPGGLGIGGGSRSDRRQQRGLGPLVRLAWVTHSIAVTVAPLITFAYFCVVVPLSSASDTALLLNVANLNLHAVNSLVVVIESLLCAVPSRLAFAVYSDAFFAAYIVANVTFWSVDRERHVLYPVIGDWGNYWQVGVPLTFVALLVGLPLLQAVHFFKYRLQIAAYERLYKRPYPHDEALASESTADVAGERRLQPDALG